MNAEKVSNGAIAGGSLTAVGVGFTPSAAHAAEAILFGLTLPELLQAAGVLIGLLGLVVKTVIDAWFRWQEMKMAQKRLEASDYPKRDTTDEYLK